MPTMQKRSSTPRTLPDSPGRVSEADPRSGDRAGRSPRDLKSLPDTDRTAAPETRRPPIVYVAGPYRSTAVNGILANIVAAREAACLVWSIGAVAICPHLNTAFMDGLLADADFLAGDLEILRRCDALYAMPAWRASEGATLEVDEAKRIGMRVLTDATDLRRWVSKRLRGEG
mgnify:CR=1 FL=1